MNYANLEKGEGDKSSSVVYKGLLTIASLMIVTGVVGVFLTFIIILAKTRNARARTTCHSMCTKLESSAMDCWCSFSNKQSLQLVQDFCADAARFDTDMCMSMDTNGCPLFYDKPSGASPCPLFGNVTDTCVSNPLLYAYVPEKFLISREDNTRLQFLNATSKALLYDSGTEVDLLIKQFENELRVKSSMIGNRSVSFRDDFLEENAASQAYYFSFMWKNPPMFRSVLSPDDPRLTPSYLINTTDRIEWKKYVVEKILSEGVSVTTRRPKFFFLGGGAGSGKTTVVNILKSQNILKQNETVYVNSDDIKVMDPIYQMLVELGEYKAASVVHKDSSDVAAEAMDKAIDAGYDIVLDGVMGSLSKNQLIIDRLNQKNYEITLIAVTVDCDIAVQRAASRAVKSVRYVPADVIIEGHDSFSTHFPTYSHVIHNVYLFDNNGLAPVLIARREPSDGELIVFDQLNYDRFLQKNYLNTQADNIFELYTNDCIALDRIKQTMKGSCASTTDTVHRYMRNYILLNVMNSNKLKSPESVCMCAPTLVTSMKHASRTAMREMNRDTIVQSVTDEALWQQAQFA